MAFIDIKSLNVAETHKCNSVACIFPMLIYHALTCLIAKRAYYQLYNLSNLKVPGSGKMAFAIVATFLTHGSLFGENFFL